MREDEDVEYCKACLSLAILGEDDVYCNVCGSTDIGCLTIDKWEALYKEKYGVSYLRDGSRKWKQSRRKNFNKLWK